MTKQQQIALIGVVLLSACTLFAQTTPQQRFEAVSGQSRPQSTDSQAHSDAGTILGTVTDVNDDPVAGASVNLQGPNSSPVYTVTTNEYGFFEIQNVQPGVAFQVTISAKGFARWESPVILMPGKHKILDVDKLRIEEVQTAITVSPKSSEEIAIQQVNIEEQQRGFGYPQFFRSIWRECRAAYSEAEI